MVEIMDQSEKNSKHLNKNLFDLLLKLTKNKSNSRIDACDDILRELQMKQDEVENPEEMCKDLEYCVERLVKGLASPRDSSRLGFALMLTEVLKHMTVVQIEDVLELMKKHLSYSSKQEKRDNVFGQLFAYSAIVRSGRLARHSHLSFVVSGIYDLWQGKSYILNASYEILVNLFTQLSKETFEGSVWPHLKQHLTCGWEKCSADLLWLMLLCLRIFPGSVPEKILKKHWNNRDIFSLQNHDYLKKIIRQTTACLPMLHPFCIEFSAACTGRKDMKDIWNALIDDNLFEADQTEKAYVGFELVKKVLQGNQKKKVIKHALSPKFRAMFTKSFLNAKHPMNPAAAHLANFLCDFVKQNKDPDIQIIILKVFLEPPGSLLSDQIFKKKEVSAIIQNLLPDGVKSYCEFLKSITIKKKNNSSDDEEEGNGIQRKGFQAVVQIGSLVCHPITITDVEWRLDVIKFLFLHAFFTIKKPIDILHCETAFDEISGTMRESLRNAFYKAMNSLHQRAEQHATPIDHFLQHLLSFTEYVDQLLGAVEYVEPCFSREKVEESWQQMKTTVHKLSKQSKKDGKTKESSAFQALLLELGLHIFYDPDHISELLQELNICCKKALHVRKHSEESATDDTEPSWVAVVIDILLSLLSRSSLHLRNVVTSVFPLLCPFITTEALQQILAVINPEKAEDDPMLVDESDGESDIDFGSGSSSDESDANDVEVKNSKVDEQFRQKIKKALGHAAEVSDADSVVLSDSEMFKLDDAIAEAFRGRIATGHTQMSVEDKTMLHFRLRCLDLVIAFLKSEPPMHLVLQCVEPVLAAFELGHKGKQQAQLLHKVLSTLQTVSKIKKFKNQDGVQKSELKTLLDNLISKCHKETDLTVANKVYSLCVFLVLCFRRLESQKGSEKKSSKTPTYLKTYLSALDVFVKGSSNVVPQFFVHLMETCPDLAWHFIVPCKEYAFNSETRIYRKTQCLGLIFEALKFSKGQNSISTDEWQNIGSSLIPVAVETLKEVLTNFAIKPVYLTELLDVVHTCHTILKEKTNKSLLEQHTDLLPLLMDMNKAQLKKLMKKGSMVRRKIILSLGGSIPKTKKKQTSEEQTPADADEADEAVADEADEAVADEADEAVADEADEAVADEVVEVENPEPKKHKRKSKSKEKRQKKKQKKDIDESEE